MSGQDDQGQDTADAAADVAENLVEAQYVSPLVAVDAVDDPIRLGRVGKSMPMPASSRLRRVPRMLYSTVRRAAAEAGDPRLVHLWAGTGYRRARQEPTTRMLPRIAAGL
ncbi:hypothetical protein [Streptomyces sp. NPDC048663]|uniref:hypothetical protein n=1 Tax=Streptomyces sp. NPDC048663 TaxID=3155638 RepID=UPI003417FFFD